MNVIVSNKQKNIIDNANIDAIKDLNGLFSVDDLINKFKNYFFSKMILDATSVIDFTSDAVLNKLARNIGSDRLIILLPSSPEPPKEFTDKLVNLKIYNFSNKIEDIVQFINHPNTYGNISEDNSLYVDNSIRENELDTSSFSNNRVNEKDSFSDMLSNFDIKDNTEINNNIDINNSNINSDSKVESITNNIVDENNISNSDSTLENSLNNISLNENINTNNYENNVNINDDASNNRDNDLMNNTVINNFDNINDELNQNNNQTIFQNNNEGNIYNNDFKNEESVEKSNNENAGFYLNQVATKKIIGIKNVTVHAGSTTLTYLLMNMLKNKYKKRVSAVEINKNDFKYYQDNTMISVAACNVTSVLNNNDEIIIVDLNDCHDTSFCNDIIYLVEPSIIKLNRLMMENRFAFRELQNKRIVLNKSLLSSNDVKALSKEAGVEMFMNIPPVNDRINNQIIEDLINKLGLN